MTGLTRTLLLMTSRKEKCNIKLKWKSLKRKGNCSLTLSQFLFYPYSVYVEALKELSLTDKYRVDKYERDLKRWEFMDEETQRQSQRI